MKALVTGGTGFVGSPVVDLLLKEGHAVRLFCRSSRLPDRLQGKDVEPVTGDLADADAVVRAMENTDVFLHIGEIKNRTRDDARKNVSLVETIAGNLTRQGVSRFVFISSISVAGVPSRIPADETTPAELVPQDHYTTYKREAEEVIAGMKGADYVILRPAPVYGPGSRYLGQLIRLVALFGPIGIPFIGDGNNFKPLIHVDDLAEAIVRAGTIQKAAGQIFTIADGLRHTWRDFFTAVADAQGKKLRMIPIPPLLVRLPAPFVDLIGIMLGVVPDVTSYTRFLTADLLFDVSKAQRLLGWTPRHTDVEAAVREMVAAYR